MDKNFSNLFRNSFFLLVHVPNNNWRWPQNRPFFHEFTYLERKTVFLHEKWWINLHARNVIYEINVGSINKDVKRVRHRKFGIGLVKLGVRLTQIRKEFPLHPQINMWADQQFELWGEEKLCHITNDVAEMRWKRDKLLDAFFPCLGFFFQLLPLFFLIKQNFYHLSFQ